MLLFGKRTLRQCFRETEPRRNRMLLCQVYKEILMRYLSSSEVSTALRPFYFSVHPDLFGQYPTERNVNENSLKQLSSYLELIQQKRPARPLSVTFYLRSHGHESNGKFKSVKIDLSHRDIRKTVLSILNTCSLPTTYVDKIAPTPEPLTVTTDIKRSETFDESDPIHTSIIMRNMVNKSKDSQHLSKWLTANVKSAQEKLLLCKPVREEIIRLTEELQSTLGIKNVLWDCGWNVTHFRGCLQSFQALARHHPDVVSGLKGRTLLFGNDTGVSLDGLVMLNSGEVRHNWLDFMKNMHTHDAVLQRIPAFEKAVSQVLRGIQIVHRKFQPKVMAKHYENQLRRLTTSLSDHQGRRGYPKSWPSSLHNFKLVVDTEAGPLMLSPTGQFIVPASCPAFLLVSFMSDNMEEASRLLKCYERDKYVERDLREQCIKHFELETLQKDDNVTPELMISCCERLLKWSDTLSEQLRGSRLWVTHYYSVLSDGEICIPWNWKL